LEALSVQNKAHKVHSLERVIRDLAAGKEFEKIKKIIQQLCNDYAYAVHQPHARNGGLIGLAAAAIALGPVSEVV
jgi:vacuole morphology and inheritance protein 14